MAISGKMVALKDKSNNVVFPETSSQAVYMDNGKTLEALTDEGVFFGENSDVVQLSKPEIIEKVNNMESKITEVDSRLEQIATIVRPTDDLISIAKKSTRPLYLLEGTHIINEPLPFNVSFYGVSKQKTTLKASDNFVGNMLIDFNSTTLQKYITDITLDCNFKNIQHFGSTGDAEGSSQCDFSRIWFINSRGNYSVGGSSTKVVNGMLTGSTFYNCVWDGNEQILNVGQNQDDVLFLNCRFHSIENSSYKKQFNITGNNIRFESCYYLLKKNGNGTSNIFFMEIGNKLTSFNNIFIEGYEGVNYTHLFYLSYPTANIKVDNMHLNLININLKAIVRTQIQNTSGDSSYISFDNLTKYILNCEGLIDVYIGANLNKKINLSIKGVDIIDNLIVFDSSSVQNDYSIITIIGEYKNKSYCHAMNKNGSFKNNFIDGKQGLNITSDYKSITSSSPNSCTITLDNGIYDIIVKARVNGDPNHMFVKRFNVIYNGGVNKISSINDICTTAKSNGSSFGLSDLVGTISDNVVKFTTTFTSGNNVVYDINIIKLTSLFNN